MAETEAEGSIIMPVSIHPTAIVEKGAELGDGVIVGPFAYIESGAEIGAGCEIGPGAHITKYVRMGRDNKVFKDASIGSNPQDKKFGGEETLLIIGDRNSFRESVTMNRGTSHSGETVVGSDCFFMAYSHVAHDCVVGNNVIFANCAAIAGHVTIEDYVILGGMVPVHQFVTIGESVMIGLSGTITRDVPPYLLMGGDPMRLAGINIIGLRRRGFTEDTINMLRKAYRILYRSSLNTPDALSRIESEIEPIPEIRKFVDFVRDSKRGIIR
ncbi:MAG: acyl-ACP--UDP-N-acetylglucosamine O-acyltransferase [bacterium]